MGRIWAEGFWAPPANVQDPATPGAPLLLAIAGLSVVTLAITVGAEPLFAVTSRAAQQLLDREDYIRAVLGS
jgi:multicomponent Na+:H+ antiporter subunit D